MDIADLFADSIAQPSETVVILDAGEGTVKAATYVCLNSDPLLLRRVIETCSEPVWFADRSDKANLTKVDYVAQASSMKNTRRR